MTFKELHFFYSLCDNPQVTNVASALQISQSAISLAIKSLEKKLGEKLFDRVGKKLILNERGRYFKAQTFPHYLALKDAQTLFQKNKLAGKLKIAASKTISNYIMPDIYFEFLSLYPDVSFDIDSCNSTKIIEKQKEIYIDAVDKKWILRETGSGTKEIFIDCLGDMAKNINIFMQLHSFQEIKTIIVDNPDTITAISKVAVQRELKEKKLFEIKLINISFKREFSLIYNKNKTQNLFLSTFVNFIYKKLK